MTEPSNVCTATDSTPPKAIAYYRSSGPTANHANSLSIQQSQVRQFAQERGIEIVSEISDFGGAGGLTGDRAGLHHLTNSLERRGHDFGVILCVDAARLWRDCYRYDQFLDVCKQYGKIVVWTSPHNQCQRKSRGGAPTAPANRLAE